MAKINIKLPLRKRLDSVVDRLNAASINAAVGAVELPNELFDDMAEVLEELEVLVYGPRKGSP
ncbi:hypothetical protein LCGC14_0373000 [marine sediment metagenome]|uniref:Uncharacterized protein n=1 Tax=marine sediment metagenome TaxID=412755 RepID=A0A0F9T4C5_9ZZZZ